MLQCMAAVAAGLVQRPFKGVWINYTDEQYELLKMDLYEKAVSVPDGDGKCYGYLQMENDFVSDYWIITKVEQLSRSDARIRYYSLRYGLPGQDETLTVTLNAADGSIGFGEGRVFGPSSACRYVEVIRDNVNIRTSPRTGKAVAKAQTGMTFPLKGMDSGWYRLEMYDGSEGYVAGELACPWREADLRIPADALQKSGQYVEADGVTLCNVSFTSRGGAVYMEVSRSLVDRNKGTMSYLYTTLYKGKADANRLVFTEAAEGPMLMADSPDIDGKLKAVVPYTVYYSPAHCDFIVGGKKIGLQ